MRWVSFSPRMVGRFFVVVIICRSTSLPPFLMVFYQNSFEESVILECSYSLLGTSPLAHIFEKWHLSAVWLCDCLIMNEIRQILIHLRSICIFLSVGCQFISPVRFPLETFSVSQPLYTVRGYICLFGAPSWIDYLFAHWLFPLIQEFSSQQKIFTFWWKTISI